MPMTARPPTAPPTIAPIGVELPPSEEEFDADDVVVVVIVVVVGETNVLLDDLANRLDSDAARTGGSASNVATPPDS